MINTALHRKEGISLTVATSAVLIFFVISSFVTWQSVDTISDSVIQSRRVVTLISQIRTLKTEIIHAESGQRGYLITQDPEYLEPYNTAVERLAVTFRGLQQNPDMNRGQQDDLTVVDGLLRDKLNEMKETIELVQQGNSRAAIDAVRSDRGKKLMDDISVRLDAMLDESTAMLDQARDYSGQSRQRVMVLGLLTNLAGFLLISGLVWVGLRNIRQVYRLKDDLLHANEELEAKVAERTRQLEVYAGELERSNRELEEFAFVASHDLQEPLRKIQAFGDRLQSKFSAELGDRGNDYVDRMRSASSRMSLLINDLLSFSRVTRKNNPFAQTDLNSVLANVLDDLDFAVKESGADIKADTLPELDADPSQLGQVFMNLISNSLKFRKPDTVPVISVSCRLTSDDTAESGQMAEIVLQDNGIGFEMQYAERIFSLFQRLHGRNEYKGTGIGLALCRKIIERHRGTIRAESEPGTGTRFIICLPLTQPDADLHNELLAEEGANN